MSQFTKDQVLAALDEVVAERGEEYVVPVSGQYTVHAMDAEMLGMGEGAPLCIVGAVVAKLDKTATILPLLHRIETDSSLDCPLDYTVTELFDPRNYDSEEYDEEFNRDLSGEEYAFFGGVFDEDTLTALGLAQNIQDHDLDWGKARNEARTYLEGNQ